MRRENKKNAGVDLSRKMLSGARVIAKGKRIRDVRRLVAQYGGRTSRWIKKSSPQFEVAGMRFIIGTNITVLGGSRQRECE